ncbi:MAG: hypothetical protein KJ002_02470, partial [Candidatus Dadabacteria bacterium]|nr:hypothetical protein [Candidatus Dadabacteria bacterium]
MVGIRARRARLGLMAKTDAVLKNLPVSAFIRDNYLVLLIFVAGLALRIYAIGSESIWYDEA